MKNYIGVTGVANISDVFLVANYFQEAEFSMENSHVPMIGFLVCKKTLEWIPPQESKIPHQRYPPVSSLESMMEHSKNKALNMIHFGEKKDYSELAKDITELFGKTKIYSKNLCRSLQLNIPWPNEKELEKILKEFPEMNIILQLPKQILNENNLGKKVNNYSELIKGVLIDPSGGKGKELNLDNGIKLYNEIKKSSPELIVGFAGGFNEKNVLKKCEEIEKELGHKNFSIDAEGGLRDCKSEQKKMLVDMLEPNFVRKYISNVRGFFID